MAHRRPAGSHILLAGPLNQVGVGTGVLGLGRRQLYPMPTRHAR